MDGDVAGNSRYPFLGIIAVLFIMLFPMLACVQDCMGVTFRVEGFIVDEQGMPIEGAAIRAWNNGSYGEPPFEFNVASDENGYFQTDNTFSYGCTSFQIDIIADSYVTQTLTYYPPANENTNELPEEITVVLQSATN
ncbi:MAG: hypothetical protein H6670_01770 [Anaerolineaceae bacterium]|nr:hypothetical protein [Anaerolineaceae bacterium]